MYAHISETDGQPDGEALACFERLSPCLIAFASRHSLLVRKYYHNQPMWSFHFLHPKGGFGVIQIHAWGLRKESVEVAIASHWWIDDDEKCVRSGFTSEMVEFQSENPDEITLVLESTLAHVLALQPDARSRLSETMPKSRDQRGSYVISPFVAAQRLPT